MISVELSAERFARFRLSMVDGLGPIRMRALLAAFADAEQVLGASERALQQVDGIGPKLAAAILASDETDTRTALSRMTQLGARLLFEDDEEYPPALREIATRPPILMARGQILPADRGAVAIVGSRHCTAYGRKMAEQLAQGLALRGVTVVSGLARGIDGVAHEAALRAGGRTIAVLASGLARIYPPEHANLAERVQAQGAIITEAPLEGEPIAGLFPQRNRIISGMSLGVVVVEAALRSGALSTAHHAVEQNRDVMAVPGRVGDDASSGTNALIQQGAILVTNADDVLQHLGPYDNPQRAKVSAVAAKATDSSGTPIASVAPNNSSKQHSNTSPTKTPDAAPPPGLNDIEKQLWLTLGAETLPMEILLDRTGLRASQASTALLMMEMRKLVRRLPGNQYMRV